jgi:hypothetical protein
MSKVFSTAESVNKGLRALFTTLPKAKRQKAEKQWHSRKRPTREDNRRPNLFSLSWIPSASHHSAFPRDTEPALPREKGNQGGPHFRKIIRPFSIPCPIPWRKVPEPNSIANRVTKVLEMLPPIG